MHNRHDSRLFNEREWACMSVQAPLGTVILARILPASPPPMKARVAAVWSSRRFAPSNQPDSAVRKLRLRRGL